MIRSESFQNRAAVCYKTICYSASTSLIARYSSAAMNIAALFILNISSDNIWIYDINEQAVFFF